MSKYQYLEFFHYFAKTYIGLSDGEVVDDFTPLAQIDQNEVHDESFETENTSIYYFYYYLLPND